MSGAAGRHLDRTMLDLAARIACRAAGDVEPNPLVGCVIGRITGERVDSLGMGCHRVFGGPHAEIEALADCRRRGRDAAGATVWVTLEPCDHSGKTPPCARALIEANVGEVVMARRDPSDEAGGGVERLRSAGVRVRLCDASPAAIRLSEPFVKRVRTGLPWVIAKWAQTIDGRIATRTGESQWISNQRSRLDVHRLRARVDAIVTGVGTARADDPSLTARGVGRVRRTAKRVVIDARLNLSLDSTLVRTARQTPVIVMCDERAAASCPDRAGALRRAGVEVIPTAAAHGRLDLRACLARLVREFDATNVLVEAGPGITSEMLKLGLIDELRVYIAPMALADDSALPALQGRRVDTLAAAMRFQLDRVRRFDGDVALRYRASDPS